MGGDCKEHCDVYCTECGTDFEYGTETCKVCDAKEITGLYDKFANAPITKTELETYQDVREFLGLADKE